MCGICGEISLNGELPSAGRLAEMNACMRRRGPDGEGLILRGRAGFGHRRLKIIDLSEAAEQPMIDAESGLTIVYNGAIYNYPELRTELQDRGHRFFSSGDTEVILKAYREWGSECVKRFNGMFAFAIHERDTGRTFLARDRLGIKPLYYAEADGVLRFGSSLPALVAAGGIDTAIDPVGLNFYLTFHAVVPAPYTILRGVRKLPPASTFTIERDGTRRIETYWKVEYGVSPERTTWSEAQWREKTLDIMREAVRRRLIADVPVGVLLSGGLDSSLIVGLLAEQGATGLETFSIGFESVNRESGDEFQYSDIVAKRFGTKHHKIFIEADRALPALGRCVEAMSEPMVSHDNVGFFLLSEEVAKSVKVVQSGQGADEVFGGYHWYPPMLDSTDPVDDYARVFFDRNFEEYSKVTAKAYLEKDYAREFVEAHFAMPGAESPIDKAMRLDSTIMLVDDPVKRVDNHTMAHGLEARVPFLDHEVVEFAAGVPAALKVREGGKYILKEAARQVIPGEVIDRPKGYFPVPALKFLRGPFLDLARDCLTNDSARRRQLFQSVRVEQLLREPEEHITPLRGSKLWQLALLEYWLQTHGL